MPGVGVLPRRHAGTRAWSYLRALVGAVPLSAGAELAGATLYTPYHVLTFVLCGVLVWGAPQAWELTQRLTAPRAAHVPGGAGGVAAADVDADGQPVSLLPVLMETRAARLNEGEERSQRELATTEVSPRVAKAMSLAFVAHRGPRAAVAGGHRAAC